MSSSTLPMPALGTRIGRYRLVRALGRGAMGAVFEAFHDGVGGRAAIKILRIDAATRSDITKRFFDEAIAANSIEHPSIIRIFDSGHTSDGLAYLAMEYLNGENLGQRITRQGRLSVTEAIRLTRQVASALSAVHERGVIHRDLKPENLMVISDPEAPGGERIKVLDFGIARLAADLRPHGSDTASGVILGTPVYMSPEQCHGAKQVTEQSDVYSLGVILYKMLAGQAPFVSQGIGALIAMHLTESPAPIREHNANVPIDLAALLHSMLEKAPASRPTMREVDAELRSLISIVEVQPKVLPTARHEAPTRKLALVDMRAMIPPAAPPVQPDIKQRPEPTPEKKGEDTLRPSSAPPHSPSEEPKTLSRSSSRRLLLVTLAVALVGGVGIGARSLLHRPPRESVTPQPADVVISGLLSADAGADATPSSRMPSVSESSSVPTTRPRAEQKGRGENPSPVSTIPEIPPTVKQSANLAAAEPSHNTAVKIPPFRPADTMPLSEPSAKGSSGQELKGFPGSSPSRPAALDGGVRPAPTPPAETPTKSSNPQDELRFPKEWRPPNP